MTATFKLVDGQYVITVPPGYIMRTDEKEVAEKVVHKLNTYDELFFAAKTVAHQINGDQHVEKHYPDALYILSKAVQQAEEMK